MAKKEEPECISRTLMKKCGCYPDARKAFPPGYTEYRKLHSKVMVVAKVGHNNDWAVYCANVPGINSENEWQEVADNGDKVSREIAEVMFKHLARMYTYRE